MILKEPKSDFYREYDLIKARQSTSRKKPEAHQSEALQGLQEWFKKPLAPDAGGILVLPTGGGKTFTAVRFLCAQVLSQGYKVLWLAHTHHLLEQALDSFKDSTSTILEPKNRLNARVVSGTPEHFSVRDIMPGDDVVIATLQTVTNAFSRRHPALMKFLANAGDKLCVVFDEAHHSPAPSYAKLIMELREAHPGMYLLGLTATPTYGNQRKQGWLKKLFPQEIIYQVSARKLIAARILAKPIPDSYSTEVTPDFDEREYQKWIDTYQDLPEEIITALAENRERNARIAEIYAQNKEKYKKTIMFADRWPQCEQLEAFLEKKGVRAGSIYSHVGGEPSSVAERNKRDKSDNAKVLEKFRRNELDVLINIRMLTEGTDVPDVNTVFLTRQTTSQILLTQMVGRALRGPKFGGTEEAYIVAFTDRWKQQINWAEYDALATGEANKSEIRRYERPPLQLISIDLVRRLTRQMHSGVNVNPASFVSLMPLGWYIAEFQAVVENSEDIKSVSEPVMIFEHEAECYRQFIAYLQKQDLATLASESLKYADVQTEIAEWQSNCFGVANDAETSESADRAKNLFLLMRHLAQNENAAPRFFLFKEREQHDLDAIAEKFIGDRLDSYAEEQALIKEYQRTDRYWRTMYPNFDFFTSHFDGCKRRALARKRQGGDIVVPDAQVYETPQSIAAREPDEAVKAQVKKRDGYVCLCCGEKSKRRLTIDHVMSDYYGADNSLDNLQTLCKICNSFKSIKELNFRIHKNDALKRPATPFSDYDRPKSWMAGEPEEWEKYMRRNVNFFYQCAAVESVRIGRKGSSFYEWQINLYEGNSPSWFKPHLETLVERITVARETERFQSLEGIKVKSPNEADAAYFVQRIAESETRNPLASVPNGTSCRFGHQGKIFQGKILKGKLVIPRKGTFNSLSAASQAVTGKPRNGWRDWQLQLPETEGWTSADEWRKAAAK